jgi:hypothetical protein
LKADALFGYFISTTSASLTKNSGYFAKQIQLKLLLLYIIIIKKKKLKAQFLKVLNLLKPIFVKDRKNSTEFKNQKNENLLYNI